MPQGYSPFQGLARGLESGLRLGMEARALKERKEERETARRERARNRRTDVEWREKVHQDTLENRRFMRDPEGFYKELIRKIYKRAADPNVGPHERKKLEVQIEQHRGALDRHMAKHSRDPLIDEIKIGDKVVRRRWDRVNKRWIHEGEAARWQPRAITAPTTREVKRKGKIVTEEYDTKTKKWTKIGSTDRFQATAQSSMGKLYADLRAAQKRDDKEEIAAIKEKIEIENEQEKASNEFAQVGLELYDKTSGFTSKEAAVINYTLQKRRSERRGAEAAARVAETEAAKRGFAKGQKKAEARLAVRALDQMLRAVSQTPEATGFTGTAASVISSTIAQIKNVMSITGLGPEINKSIEKFGSKDYTELFSELELLGEEADLQRSEMISLAITIAALEGFIGRALTDRKIELIIRELSAASQNPRSMLRLLERKKRNISERFGLELEVNNSDMRSPNKGWKDWEVLSREPYVPDDFERLYATEDKRFTPGFSRAPSDR